MSAREGDTLLALQLLETLFFMRDADVNLVYGLRNHDHEFDYPFLAQLTFILTFVLVTVRQEQMQYVKFNGLDEALYQLKLILGLLIDL